MSAAPDADAGPTPSEDAGAQADSGSTRPGSPSALICSRCLDHVHQDEHGQMIGTAVIVDDRVRYVYCERCTPSFERAALKRKASVRRRMVR